MDERKMIDIRDTKHYMDTEIWQAAIKRAFRKTRSKITIIRGDGSAIRNYCEKEDTIKSNAERV